ncbi:MAG: hypothetical protein KJO01_02740 [Gammaproteobacteria bacterium]|nr:hypothetical protein [Gammaproteobacteria bacterium]MBT8110124.1 hypothetical protein [Gammaproteobacteria bacterium]NNL44828.1 hypothetical protein [Woeseiaceae bacterium]
MSVRIPSLYVLVGLAVALTAAASYADYSDNHSRKYSHRGEQACSKHARIMRRACSADKIDDYWVHIADCTYVTKKEDERDCRYDAREEMYEKAEECRDVYEARRDVCELVGEKRYDVEFDPADFVDPDEIGNGVAPNPYWPLTAGHTHVILGEDEVVVVTATDEVRDVGGLPCRVIRDLVFEAGEDDEGDTEYEAVEVTQDWYAQNMYGDTIYCGENTYEIEEGLIDNTDGSFANGTDRARAGFLVRAMPVPGEGDRQEMATDEAEDYVEYISLAATPSDDEGGDVEAFPCNGECLKTFEVNPRDPGQAEHKYYLPGTGFVLAAKLDEDGNPTGEREEVSCSGDSLDEVLEDDSCGIADFEALRDAMCIWAPEGLGNFCDE